MNTPQNLFYTQSDEWLRPEADGTVTIGISDYAQGELGEIVYVELPEIGQTINDSAPFGVVESVKAVGELHSAIAGEVVAINTQTTESPSTVNESPYENGWLIQIRPDSEPDWSALMDAEAYDSYRG